MNIQSHYTQNSSAIVKLGMSRQIAIPKRFWSELKLRSGEYMQIKPQGQSLVLTPKTLVDKNLEEGLAQSFKDFEEGRSYGPFETAEEAIAFLNSSAKKYRSRLARKHQ